MATIWQSENRADFPTILTPADEAKHRVGTVLWTSTDAYGAGVL